MANADELYHYGVLGMKWGVRKKGYDKYVSKAEKHEAKAAEALAKGRKHAYFKNSDKAKDYRYMAKTAKRMQENKGIIGRQKAKFGYDSRIDRKNLKADKMADRGENRRFKVTRAKALKNESILRRGAKILEVKAKTPIRTMGGRYRDADQRAIETWVGQLIGAPNVIGAYNEWRGYRKNNK